MEIAVIHKVTQMRLALNYSQEVIAEILNVSKGFIGQIETPSHPSKYNLNHLNILSRELGCSPKDFMPQEPIEE